MKWSRLVIQQVTAAIVVIIGMSLLFGGFGLVFLLGQPSPLWAAAGGASMGAAIVCFGVVYFLMMGGEKHE
mgnify:CR=1 FL=1